MFWSVFIFRERSRREAASVVWSAQDGKLPQLCGMTSRVAHTGTDVSHIEHRKTQEMFGKMQVIEPGL